MAEAVVVGVRVRPFSDRERKLNADLCIEMNGPNTTIHNPEGGKQYFAFDESFWSHDGYEDDGTGYIVARSGSAYADQRYVFDTFGKRVLDNAWDGFHCCLFAYGQTGAGKSYSMVGYGSNKGIVPISCDEIFKRIDANSNDKKRFEVTVSMIEIYNETVQDLLILPADRPKKGLEIRESKVLGIYIDGVVRRPVANYPEIEETCEEATSHRTVGATQMNATSSRAHTVLTIDFKQVENIGGKDSVKISMINLVDLAGSEKARQTGAAGDRLKEGCAINKSLTSLGNVIEKLAEKSQTKNKKTQVIIPYRDSKLTRLLQNALGGSSKTIMICALSPASSNYEETLSTLRYADRAKKIKNTAAVNENPQDKLMRELKEENEQLKLMMTGGGGEAGTVDAIALAQKQAEIVQVELALREMQRSFEDRLAESRANVKSQSSRRSVFRATLRPRVPLIVNLNEDMQLTGKIRYALEENQVTRIGQRGAPNDDEAPKSSSSSGSGSGSDEESVEEEEPDISLVGDGVYGRHATVHNKDGQCVLASHGVAAQRTYVNGLSVATLLKEKGERVCAVAGPDTAQASGSEVSLRLSGNVDSAGEPKDEMTAEEKAMDMEWFGQWKKEEVVEEKKKGVVEEKERKEEGHEGREDKNEEGEDEKDIGEMKETQKKDLDQCVEGILLKHADRVVFGAKCIYLFVDPSEGLAEQLIISGQVSFSKAKREIITNRIKNAAHSVTKVMNVGKLFKAPMNGGPGAQSGASSRDDVGTDQSCSDEGPKRCRQCHRPMGPIDDGTSAQLRLELDVKDKEIERLRRELRRAREALARAGVEEDTGGGPEEESEWADSPLHLAPSLSEGTRKLLVPRLSADGSTGASNPFSSIKGLNGPGLSKAIATSFEEAISAIDKVQGTVYAIAEKGRKARATLRTNPGKTAGFDCES